MSAAIAVGMWACDDSASSTDTEDTVSLSSSSKVEESSASTEKSTKKELSSSSSAEKSLPGKSSASGGKSESSSSGEVSGSGKESEPSSSSSEECTGRRCKKDDSSSSAKSSSEEESSSSEEEIVIDCTGKTHEAGLDSIGIVVDGKERHFFMRVPAAYKGDKPVPLVVDYHPIGGNGKSWYGGSNYKNQTEPEGVISLYPSGTAMKEPKTSTLKGMPGWNVGPCCSDDDDEKFTREMIKAVEKLVCIDKRRVYATGFSMGGGMAHQVACSMSDVFAAVAPAAMDLNWTNSSYCAPERPISVIMFRSLADRTCSYQGGDSGFNDGLNFLGAVGTFRFWAEKNGCEGTPSENSDGCEEYSSCKDGTKVVLCIDKELPPEENPKLNKHIQGDPTIGWPFLKQFTLPASFVK